MDCVSPILDFFTTRLRDTFSVLFGHIISLEGNVHSLGRAMHELECLRDDVIREVDAAERQGLTRTNQVRWWLESVENLTSEAAAIEVEFDRLLKCFGDCPINLCSRYRLGRRAAEKLTEVSDLKGRDVLSKVADGFVVGKIEELPTTCSSIGMDLLSERLGNYVRGDEVNVIGLHGMGGVGKTTLLRKFNNQLLSLQHGFDLVVLLEVTRDFDIDRMQRALGGRLGLRWPGNEDTRERAAHILRVLSKLNFVMFLDDVWEPLDLSSVGIPTPGYLNGQHRRKIIVATQIDDVCINMDAQKIMRVECLPMEEAWELFVQKVDNESIISHPQTLLYAKEIVKICGGLPLALTTMGRVMATKRTHREWLDALGTFALSPWDLPGVAETLLDRLRPSYDHLSTDDLKQCFLFCALFPQGFPIQKILLLYYWLSEGILHMPGARSNCDEIIGMLIRASCLLDHDGSELVKMHGMMRSLALWIASEHGQRKNKWIVEAGVVMKEAPRAERWNEAERISLMHNGTNRLLPVAVPPSCPKLVSLMLQYNEGLRSFPGGFFHFMPSLVILDLSHTCIRELPPAIGMLPEMRYLGLFRTKLVALPEELGQLAKLMFLELGHTTTLRFIPRGTIARLSPTLMLLGTFKTRIDWYIGDLPDGHGVCFEELEGLQQLEALDISIGDVSALQWLSSVEHLASSIGKLQIFGCEGMASITLPSILGKSLAGIKMLAVSDSSELQEVVIDCDDVEFSLTYLGGLEFCNLARAKIIWRGLSPHTGLVCLHTLIITNCPAIEQLVEGVTFAIMGLQELHLTNLPQLRSICCNIATIFPTMQYLKVDRCPNLMRLPVGSTGDDYMLTKIAGQREWWDGLEWQDGVIKTSFDPLFKQLMS